MSLFGCSWYDTDFGGGAGAADGHISMLPP